MFYLYTAQPFLHVTHRPEIHPLPRQAPAMTSRSAGHPRPVHGAARRPSPPHASVSTRGWCRQMRQRSSLPLPAQPARHAPAATHNAPNQATPSTSIARPDEGHACRQRLLLPEAHIRGQERRGEGADSTTLTHAPAPSPRRSPYRGGGKRKAYAPGSIAAGYGMLTEGHKALLGAQRLVLGVSDATANQSRPRSRSISPRRLPMMGAGCAAHRPRRRR